MKLKFILIFCIVSFNGISKIKAQTDSTFILFITEITDLNLLDSTIKNSNYMKISFNIKVKDISSVSRFTVSIGTNYDQNNLLNVDCPILKEGQFNVYRLNNGNFAVLNNGFSFSTNVPYPSDRTLASKLLIKFYNNENQLIDFISKNLKM